jgi:transcriptional regulator with XRE-family HTH domain
MSREIHDTNIFGMRLKQARSAAGLSQKQLGINAGIDRFVASTRINRYELGVHKPDVTIAKALAKALKVPTAFLYTPEDELAEFLFRLGRISASEQKALFRSLSHIPDPQQTIALRKAKPEVPEVVTATRA